MWTLKSQANKPITAKASIGRHRCPGLFSRIILEMYVYDSFMLTAPFLSVPKQRSQALPQLYRFNVLSTADGWCRQVALWRPKCYFSQHTAMRLTAARSATTISATGHKEPVCEPVQSRSRGSLHQHSFTAVTQSWLTVERGDQPQCISLEHFVQVSEYKANSMHKH